MGQVQPLPGHCSWLMEGAGRSGCCVPADAKCPACNTLEGKLHPERIDGDAAHVTDGLVVHKRAHVVLLRGFLAQRERLQHLRGAW